MRRLSSNPSAGNELLIVDGYNVLHNCGLIRGQGPGALERARHLLIGLMQRHLPPDLKHRAVVVFDSSNANVERQTQPAAAIRVEFAVDHATADDRIIELIRRHSTPRKLLVVSADREIRQAAQSRRAAIADSMDWLDELVHQRREAPAGQLANAPPSTAVDVEYWMRELGIDDTTFPDEGRVAHDDVGKQWTLDDPFPPGFGSDLNESL